MFNIRKEEWVHFASKPFSLFAISLWDHCYSEYIGVITKGVPVLRDTIFIQDKDGVVRNYRKKKDLERVKHILLALYKSDIDFIKRRLNEADDANAEGKDILDGAAAGDAIDLQKAIDLACRVTMLGSVLPRFLSQALVDAQIFDNDIIDHCIELKKTSLYPRILSEIIEPQISQRMLMQPNDTRMHFVYVSELGQVDTIWTDHPETYIGNIEGDQDASTRDRSLKGIGVFSGIVQGKAAVCLTMDGSDIASFGQGDILVTHDSNPNLGHLIERAGGLIVEEGVLSVASENEEAIVFNKSQNDASHAAILSKGYAIPCIMGVKNATTFIKTGDLVEIDGSKGTIRFL